MRRELGLKYGVKIFQHELNVTEKLDKSDLSWCVTETSIPLPSLKNPLEAKLAFIGDALIGEAAGSNLF